MHPGRLQSRAKLAGSEVREGKDKDGLGAYCILQISRNKYNREAMEMEVSKLDKLRLSPWFYR